MSASLDVLVALESPLLDGLAPELVGLRARAAEAAAHLEDPAGCQGCARAAVIRTMTVLATELQATLDSSPELRGLFPALMTTAQQSMHHG